MIPILIVTFTILISGFEIYAQSNISQTVRIRLFKDLDQFPQVAGAKLNAISPRLWTLTGTNLKFNGRNIFFKNLIVKKNNRKFDFISEIDFDYYLAGVVASEMPQRWPDEALKAQAVVARSYALVRMQERKDKIFQLDADQADQMFNRMASARTLAAVKATEQRVLLNLNGEVLKAFYHADCGGQTVPASRVWPTEKDSGVAVDPWCKSRLANNWNFELSHDLFLKRLGNPAAKSLKIGSMMSQKIQSIQLGINEISVQKLRQIFGFAVIRNSPESMTLKHGTIHLSGKGFGHGVGLCQWGTYEQALRGVSHLQILEHYYPEAHLSSNEIRISQIDSVRN